MVWSAGTILFGIAARRIAPSLLNRTRLFLAAIGTALVAMLMDNLTPWGLFTSMSWNGWLWLGLSAIVGLSVGDLFGFSGLRILGARRQSVIGTTSPIAALAAGYWLLDESIDVYDAIGAFLCVAGVMWAVGSAGERGEVKREGFGLYSTGFMLSLAGAICQGLGLVLAKMGLDESAGVAHATFIRMLIGWITAYGVDIVRRDKILPMKLAFSDKEGRTAMLWATIAGPIIGVTCSLAALATMRAGIAQTIFALVPLVVIGMIAVRHREKIALATILGTTIAIAGVAMIIWT